jgi:myo-inositol-1(or 4)-monophosphatase
MCCDGGVNARGASTGNDPEQLRSLAERLAVEAAGYVRRRRPEVFAGDHEAAVGTKSTPTDPVTIVDTETEALLRDRLAELRPDDPVLGEEGGGPSAADTAAGVVTWALDPIDGTVNFVYGVPVYAVSVAARIDGVSVAGAVADVPGCVLYSAARGHGAHVRDEDGRRRLRCTGATELSMALVGTGFGYATARRAAQARLLAELLPQVRDVRRMGSAALDLCMVAAGRLDAYYEHGLGIWDWAAGALIAAEAGADVWVPGPRQGSGVPVLAATPGIAVAFRAALEPLGGLAELA